MYLIDTRKYDDSFLLAKILEKVDFTDEETKKLFKHFEIPTVDTVGVVAKNETTTEVIRCKDCVYCKRFNDVWYLPKRDELLCTRCVETYHTTENDFCSWGERREDANN